MKVWKSPVFYFGILLVIAVAGLLAAPFIVNWNGYRADLEAYGKKLTGRTVKIEGPISARLFPWPRLTADNVTISNPPGLDDPEFARADRIVVRMTLAGLANGGIDVEAVEIEGPVVRFQRLATGEGNWVFKPAADLIESDILSRVRLDQITLRDGSLQFSDRRRGEVITLDDFNATISSPSVRGPWRMRSVSLHDDKPYDIAFTTGTWVADEPFRIGLSVAAADGSGLVFSFDGTQDGETAEGEIRAEPASTGEGKSDAEGAVRPLVFTSKIKATFDAIAFDDIEIAPSDPQQGGVITTGSARLTLGRHIDARVDLTSSMLDLDELAGAESRSLLRKDGGLALADSFLKLLPGDMSLSGSVKVTALKTGGETLDNFALSIEADRNALRIGEFSTGLPGRSQMLFKGVYFPGGSAAELAGDLALESNDLRALALWGWPEGKDSLASLWTGSRGRFKMQTDVSVTASRFRLSKTQYELDGERGSGELSVTSAGRGAVDLRIDGNRIDIDSFMPQGVSTLSSGVDKGVTGLVSALLPEGDVPDLRLTLQAAELLLNGVTASDVALDLQSGANGLELRTLSIGSVGGARLEANGLILDAGQGPNGSFGLDVTAEDPRELLRLLGLVRGRDDPAWALDLGPTALRGDLGVEPAAEGSTISFGLNGKAGQLTIDAKGNVSARMDIGIEASVASAQSARLMALMGLEPALGDSAPGRIEFKAAGTPKDGFMTNASLQAYGARFDYQGSIDPKAQGFGLEGKLTARSAGMGDLVAAMGLPLSTAPDDVMSVDADIVTEGTTWKLSEIAGRFGDNRIEGSAELDAARKLSAQISLGQISLVDVLAPAFLSWTGARPDIETSFSSSFPFGLTGEVWIRPETLQVHQHFLARGAELGVIVSSDEIRLAMFAKDDTGRDAAVEISSRGSDSSRTLEGRVKIPVDLFRQLALVNGTPVASGLGMLDVKFDSEGRSPGGALAALRGSGSYDFEDLRLLGITPSAFNATLASAKDAAGITAAFDALRAGEGLSFGKVSGTITITNGEVGFLPFGLKSAEADVQVKPLAELALGEIDAAITLSLKGRPDLPAMSLSYAGPPAALSRNEDNSELATKLGVTIMQQGIDELERLQQEQKRLAAEEEKQRVLDEERLAAYYAQRDELILRKREIKVHAEMRVLEAERLRRQIEAERAANAEMNKSEIRQRQREIRTYRRLARVTAVPQPKPKPVQPASARPKPAPIGPVILDQPEGAPVIISAEPGAPPSQ
jgi:hypothetical protein